MAFGHSDSYPPGPKSKWFQYDHSSQKSRRFTSVGKPFNYEFFPNVNGAFRLQMEAKMELAP